MLRNLVLRIIIFGALVALISGIYLFIQNLASVGAFLVNIPSMICVLFTALPINIFTVIGGLVIWEALATVFPRPEKKEKKQK